MDFNLQSPRIQGFLKFTLIKKNVFELSSHFLLDFFLEIQFLYFWISCSFEPGTPVTIKIENQNLEIQDFNNSVFETTSPTFVPIESTTRTKNHYYCQLCQKKFSSKYYMKNHTQRKHSNGNFRCEYCQKHFSSLIQKTTHESRHLLNLEYSCHFCEKQFKTPREMRSHENHRHGKFKCGTTTCDAIFDSLEKLNTHTAQIHKAIGHIEQKNQTKLSRVFKCKFCPKYFVEESSWQVRILILFFYSFE